MRLLDLGSLIGFFTVLSFAPIAHANTDLKLNNDNIVIQGTGRASMTFNILAFYTPSKNFDKSQSGQNCKFAEDAYCPNDADKAVVIKATLDGKGGYSINIPATGIRGSCKYSLDSVYADMHDGVADENLKLQTSASIAKMNDDLASVGGADPVTSLSDLKTMYCQFADEYEVGLCGTADSDLLEIEYQISSKPETYTLDIKDVSERPEPKY